jgi:hypothetical protein
LGELRGLGRERKWMSKRSMSGQRQQVIFCWKTGVAGFRIGEKNDKKEEGAKKKTFLFTAIKQINGAKLLSSQKQKRKEERTNASMNESLETTNTPATAPTATPSFFSTKGHTHTYTHTYIQHMLHTSTHTQVIMDNYAALRWVSYSPGAEDKPETL